MSPTRRDFIGAGAVAGAALGLGSGLIGPHFGIAPDREAEVIAAWKARSA